MKNHELPEELDPELQPQKQEKKILTPLEQLDQRNLSRQKDYRPSAPPLRGDLEKGLGYPDIAKIGYTIDALAGAVPDPLQVDDTDPDRPKIEAAENDFKVLEEHLDNIDLPEAPGEKKEGGK